MIDWVSGPFETYCIPDIFTPNVITIMGNLAIPVVVMMIICNGTSYTTRDATRDDLLVLGALAL